MSKVKITVAICLLVIPLLSIDGCGSSASLQTNPIPTETSKREGASAVAAFSKVLDEYHALSDSFQAHLGDMTSSEVDVEVYKTKLVKLHEQALVISDHAEAIQVAEQYQEAKEILTGVVDLLEKSINDILTYLETEDMKQLTLGKEEFNLAKTASYAAEKALNKQAAIDGYKK